MFLFVSVVPLTKHLQGLKTDAHEYFISFGFMACTSEKVYIHYICFR